MNKSNEFEINKIIDDFQKWLQNEKIVSLSSCDDKNNLLVARNGYWADAFEIYKLEEMTNNMGVAIEEDEIERDMPKDTEEMER